MKPLQTILVGVDFSECSAAALKEAMRLARSHNAVLKVAHVIDTQVALELEASLSQFQGEIRKSLIAEAERSWNKFAASLPGADVLRPSITVEHRTMGLLRMARELKADLLVLGAFGTQKPDVGAGTIATSCVRHACCDVLLVRDTHAGKFRRVVAAVDFSETSLRSLERAAQIAGFDAAELHVVHVHAPPWDPSQYAPGMPAMDPHFCERYRSILSQKLAEFASPITKAHGGLKVHCALSDAGRHRSGVVDYAQRVEADLICLGTRGWSNFRDMLLGSTAEKTLLTSKCSVLAVKPEKFADSMCVR